MIPFTVVYFLCTFTILLVPNYGNEADNQMSMIKKLRKDLLDKYDKLARPVENTSMPIQVSIQFVPISLVDLDEKTATVTLNVWIPLMWMDDKLKWNPEDYGDIMWTHLGPDEAWNPNIVVVNCIPITETEQWHRSHLILSHLGIVYQAIPATLRTRCPKMFTQNKNEKVCNITIGAWMSKGNELQLISYWDEVITEELANNNSVWEITDMKYYLEDFRSNPRYFSTFTFSLYLKRRYDFTKYVTDGPRTVAILLTLVMFWLPPNSNKKINLGCLVLILLSSVMLYLSSTVSSPSLLSSTVSPLRNTFLVAGSALLIEALILNLSRLSVVLSISPTLVRILSGTVGRIIGVCPPGEFKEEGGMTNLSENYEEQTVTKQCLSREEHWLILAMTLDRIFFIVYLLLILIV
ncbi:acetylcholine receptor subunit beta-type unc-29-like [Centruroides sculpturatus]|uniref:acetylcholine receptor subunit beta-type unc-29-like n=1 Tax=Centruroides sculpturatus TaxID=218467 RepID=UPI000C6E4C2F|nr:acetylcholine receptor subunit beta-type unc-29-like [Centruroides sculpturatus]